MERWDIFCKVVDNLGDAGVCWRLARLLANEQDACVRLVIDDLATLATLEPRLDRVTRQSLERVEIVCWRHRGRIEPADVIIEAFGCGLPDDYVGAIGARAGRCVWIVLEYLSAEAWVPEHHGLLSPHPRLPIERYFFFPGLVESTGGLLREHDLLARRERFDDASRRAFWSAFGCSPPSAEALVISLFAYQHAPFEDLLECWAAGSAKVVAAMPEGPWLARVRQWLGASVPMSRCVVRGNLDVRLLPFLPQVLYDELLWSCDCNIVRGEDSFVRAQWAARPLAWHIYPQAEGAHLTKLDAFLDLYCAGLPHACASAVRGFMHALNRNDFAAIWTCDAWRALAAALPLLRQYGSVWADRIAAPGELAHNLASFCRAKLK